MYVTACMHIYLYLSLSLSMYIYIHVYETCMPDAHRRGEGIGSLETRVTDGYLLSCSSLELNIDITFIYKPSLLPHGHVSMISQK